eukprot:gb/GECG01003979.1/.p1 GENE.gb/GECG01003979.1/~~gb/GECG01003979.1/.p1  ORF type:complete len:100 (+),score=10.59 gb/GECG01003979.1/:1-300(+)
MATKYVAEQFRDRYNFAGISDDNVSCGNSRSGGKGLQSSFSVRQFSSRPNSEDIYNDCGEPCTIFPSHFPDDRYFGFPQETPSVVVLDSSLSEYENYLQ